MLREVGAVDMRGNGRQRLYRLNGRALEPIPPRYAVLAEGFGEVGFHGEYREIVPDERLVSTEAYDGIPDADEHAALDTLTLTEVDGRTTLTILVEHPTKEGRDAHINSGMEDGMQDAMDLLEEVVASLR